MSVYNGWKNWETWNVALWIKKDEGLYREAKRFRNHKNPYEEFIEYAGFGGRSTPDDCKWDDPKLDIDALNKMIGEL